jgi:hypothetical protein
VSPEIGYKTIATDGWYAAAVDEAWAILGSASPSAWLEDPARVDGLLLRDGDVQHDEARQWLAMWPEGRLFGPGGELRWTRPDATGVHLVLISDTMALPATYSGRKTISHLYDERTLLWGRYDSSKNAWLEGRIPELRYPERWPGPYAGLYMRYYELSVSESRPYISEIVRYWAYDGAVEL